MEEQIAHAAGAVTAQEERISDLVALIRDAGRIPVQRDTLYNTVRSFA
jgi:aminodeoxyfutalosine synthase